MRWQDEFYRRLRVIAGVPDGVPVITARVVADRYGDGQLEVAWTSTSGRADWVWFDDLEALLRRMDDVPAE